MQFARSIYSAGNDLLSLINDILDISKVEAGKLDVYPELLILTRMLDGLKSLFLAQALEKSLRFEIELDDDLPASLFTDRQRLEQILKNLLSNAFKFTEQGSVVLQVSRHDEQRIAFAVRDTGIGIAEEQQAVIFEPSGRPMAPPIGVTAVPAWDCRFPASWPSCSAAPSK